MGCHLFNKKCDCTRVVEFCEEWQGAQLYQPFAPTWDAFCREVLQVEPAWIDKICQGVGRLREQGHQGPVPRTLAERATEIIPLAKHGTNQYTTQETELQTGVDNINSSLKGGTSSSYLLARLKRDHPDIHAAQPIGAVGRG